MNVALANNFIRIILSWIRQQMMYDHIRFTFQFVSRICIMLQWEVDEKKNLPYKTDNDWFQIAALGRAKEVKKYNTRILFFVSSLYMIDLNRAHHIVLFFVHRLPIFYHLSFSPNSDLHSHKHITRVTLCVLFLLPVSIN